MEEYNIKWLSQSRDAGECMPLGGGDVGCNVWVEKNTIYLYMAQSGAFDEKGNMVKAGRVAVEITPNPFRDFFSQELRLEKGDIEIVGITDRIKTNVIVWVDVFSGTVHIQVESSENHKVTCKYDNWRRKCYGYEYEDKIYVENDTIIFYHNNRSSDVFEMRISEEELESIKEVFPNVQKDRIFGGALFAEGLCYIGKKESEYAQLPCEQYTLQGDVKKADIHICLLLECPSATQKYIANLKTMIEESKSEASRKEENIVWWKEFWNRSYVYINRANANANDVNWQMARNYQLFRYMLACNAYGSYPTKFNGGLFNIDPQIWGTQYGSSTPDERDWGGLVFTAQNQRHMYWPMLKSGDFDMMKPQFDFYLRILKASIARTSYFWGTQNAACIPEQVDANGLSSFYGKHGLDYPLHVRYHYITSVEFSYMMLKYIEATKEKNIQPYIEFIDAVLNFYDQVYAELDENGRRIIFPSTALETYHGADNIDVWGEEGRRAANYNPKEVAVTNPADVIYALRAVIKVLLVQKLGNGEQRQKWRKLLEQLPEVPLEKKKNQTVIAPCEEPKEYVKINCEFPQLYACFPYHEIGIGGEAAKELQLGIDTYRYGWDDEDQLSHISWMHMGIFAARLGLAEEALAFMQKKLGDGTKRFPAFWGPGHDYTPDHNWGGSGMTGLQEMLLQNFGGKIYLLPAWPKNLDVEFKLWIEKGVFVECSYVDGIVSYAVSDPSRENDVIVMMK